MQEKFTRVGGGGVGSSLSTTTAEQKGKNQDIQLNLNQKSHSKVALAMLFVIFFMMFSGIMMLTMGSFNDQKTATGIIDIRIYTITVQADISQATGTISTTSFQVFGGTSLTASGKVLLNDGEVVCTATTDVVGYEPKWKNLTNNVQSDLTIIASFEPIVYRIIYYPIDKYEPYNNPNPTTYTIVSPDINLVAPTRTGFTFNGWSVSANSSAEILTSYTIPTGSTGNQYVYERWTGVDTVPYKIDVYLENDSPEYTYTFYETLQGTATAGESITVSHDGYDSQNVQVAGDGSTDVVVELKFPRKTLYFYNSDRTLWYSTNVKESQLSSYIYDGPTPIHPTDPENYEFVCWDVGPAIGLIDLSYISKIAFRDETEYFYAVYRKTEDVGKCFVVFGIRADRVLIDGADTGIQGRQSVSYSVARDGVLNVEICPYNLGGDSNNLGTLSNASVVAYGQKSDGTIEWIISKNDDGTPKQYTDLTYPNELINSYSEYPKSTDVGVTYQFSISSQQLSKYDIISIGLVVEGTNACLVEGTEITLANGDTKKIEDVGYDDLILTWNSRLGKYDYSYLIWKEKGTKVNGEYMLINFDDGSHLKVYNDHTVFSVDENRFVNVLDSEHFKVGTTVFKHSVDENGKVVFDSSGQIVSTTAKVVSIEYVKDTFDYYFILTSKYYNSFANGFLTSEPTENFSNIFYFDENMKMQEDLRNEYVVTQDFYDFEDLSDVMTDFMFYSLDAKYIKYLALTGRMSLDEIKNYFRSTITKTYVPYETMLDENGQEVIAWCVTTSNEWDNMFDKDYVKAKYANGSLYEFIAPTPVEGKTFLGWTLSNGDGTLYQVGDTIKVYGGMHFVAVWE